MIPTTADTENLMKMLAALLLALTPTLAHADKTILTGKGVMWDCATDPVVYINHGNGHYKLSGACKSITLNGGKNTLTIESVETLAVNGGFNTITIGILDSVSINGSDNKITYKAAKSDKVKTDTLGADNTIEQRK